MRPAAMGEKACFCPAVPAGSAPASESLITSQVKSGRGETVSIRIFLTKNTVQPVLTKEPYDFLSCDLVYILLKETQNLKSHENVDFPEFVHKQTFLCTALKSIACHFFSCFSEALGFRVHGFNMPGCGISLS